MEALGLLCAAATADDFEWCSVCEKTQTNEKKELKQHKAN